MQCIEIAFANAPRSVSESCVIVCVRQLAGFLRVAVDARENGFWRYFGPLRLLQQPQRILHAMRIGIVVSCCFRERNKQFVCHVYLIGQDRNRTSNMSAKESIKSEQSIHRCSIYSGLNYIIYFCITCFYDARLHQQKINKARKEMCHCDGPVQLPLRCCPAVPGIVQALAELEPGQPVVLAANVFGGSPFLGRFVSSDPCTGVTQIDSLNFEAMALIPTCEIAVVAPFEE